MRTLGGASMPVGSTSAAVTITPKGSPASASQATSTMRRSFWNSVEQVTSTSGVSTSSSARVQRIHVRGDHALERAEREAACEPVAQPADQVVARDEAEAERGRIARGQRHRRYDRGGPWKPGSLRRRRGAPGSLVDQQHAGLLDLDRPVEVGNLKSGALAELTEAGPERPEARSRPSVLGLEALDLPGERLSGDAE